MDFHSSYPVNAPADKLWSASMKEQAKRPLRPVENRPPKHRFPYFDTSEDFQGARERAFQFLTS